MENWIQALINKMTLEEKINMIHGTALFKNGGVPRLDIPELTMSDGPCGVRFDHKDDEWVQIRKEQCVASWLPSGCALASTWNNELAYKIGDVLGKETRGRGKDIILAPGINIQRTPLCGRNFEYMSEDPTLTSGIACAEINGIQNNDVAACVKHFALNNQETDRMSVDVIVDDEALYEIYLPAFQATIENSNVYSIMCSYNKIDGTYASENKRLLTDILKNEWNYDGLVISDWGAVHSTDKSVDAGLDIEMSVTNDFDDYYFASPLREKIESGTLQESVLDDKIARILRLQHNIKLDRPKERKKGCYNLTAHHETILNSAREGVVLLKNNNGILPINRNKIKSIAVIGDVATRPISHGGGSSEVSSLFEITPLLGISMIAGGDIEINYAPGYYIDNEKNVAGEVDWQATSLDVSGTQSENQDHSEHSNKIRHELLNQACSLAKSSDLVLFFGGLNRAYDTEGFDRNSYELPYEQDILIQALIETNPNTVISIQSGSAIQTVNFDSIAPAILWNSMNGMYSGLALAEIIFGDVNPSGKCPISFPTRITDCPAHSIGEYPGTIDKNDQRICHYTEGLFIGYRHYLTHNIPVQYCFGHGLSYTSFEYYDLITNKSSADEYVVSARIKNTGMINGKEVVQLYMTYPSSLKNRPELELKAYTKVSLQAGEEKLLSFTLIEKDFHYYSCNQKSFQTESGSYKISLGSSCEDIRLTTIVTHS